MKGTAKTVYVATVMYHDPDGDLPAKVEVYVDNVAYPMVRVHGAPANGTYRARLTLPPGEHTYSFYTEDTRGASERFPRYGAYNGPSVGTTKPMNRLPILTDGGVYFDNGSERNFYTYTVHYQDPDVCKPPMAVKVFVDGIPHDMKLHAGTQVNGTYVYRAMLPEGQHAYYFMAKDGDGDCAALPEAGFIRGPEIAAAGNTPPTLIDQGVEPATGGMHTHYGFLVHYNDVDFDTPVTALIYVDNIPHAMHLITGSAYNGLYSYVNGEFLEALHTYYYYFEDGKGGSCRLPAIGVFGGPIVTR